MMPLPRLAVLTALAAALVACSSTEGPSADRNAGRPVQQVKTGLPIEPYAAGELGYVVNWITDLDLPKKQNIHTATVLEDLGLLITVEAPNNLVTAVSLRDGELRWRQVIGGEQESLHHAHTVNEDQLLVNSETRLYVLSATDGRIEGLSNLESTVVSDPAVFGDYAVFGGRNGVIFAHDIRAGFAKWSYKLPGSILTGPVASGANVFVADSAGSYAMLNGTDGTLLWRNKTWGPVTGQPSVALAGIYVPCRDRSLYALNRTSGNDVWIYRTTVPLTDEPTPLGRLILQPVPGQGLHAVNSQDGQLQWKHDGEIQPIKLVGDNLLFKDLNKLLLLSAEDGRLVQTVSTQTLDRVLNGPDDSLIAITPKGRVLRLNPRK